MEGGTQADARVLGKLLAAQNLLSVLPTRTQIADFYATSLATLPGTLSCRVCLAGVASRAGEDAADECAECLFTRSPEAEQITTVGDYSCPLKTRPDIVVCAIETLHERFGFFVFTIDRPDVFEVYRPFVSNLATFVATGLENRLHRDALQKARDELEARVDERTRELRQANALLTEEIQERRRAEEALQHEQTLLSRITDTSPVSIVMLNRDGQTIFANPQAERVLGLQRSDILGRDYNAPEWRITDLHDRPFPDEELPFRRVMALRQPVYDIQHAIQWPDGRRLFLSVNGAPVLDESGEVESAVFTLQDITERKQAEVQLHRLNRELRAISNCNQALMRAEDEETLLREICNIICDEAGYRMAWVGYADNDAEKTVRPVAWAGVEDGFLAESHITWADTERGRGPSGMAIRSGQSICIADLFEDPRVGFWTDRFRERGYRSGISLPLRERNDAVFGTLAIYSSEANSFPPEETRLLEELAGDLAFGVSVLRSRADLKRVEEERLAHVRFLEALDRFNDAVHRTNDLEGMMREVLDVVLAVFDCDRASLVFPCDPDSDVWQTRMERIRHDLPDAAAMHVDAAAESAVDAATSRMFQRLLDSSTPVAFGEADETEVPSGLAGHFRIRSKLAMAIHPKGVKPWVFAVDQISRDRRWTEEERRLFGAFGTRMSDGLTTLLAFRDSLDSSKKLGEAQRIAHIGYWDRDLAGGKMELSDEACRIFGLSPDNRHLSLKEWHEQWLTLIHPDDRDRTARAAQEAMQGGNPYNIEYRIIRPDGGIRSIHSEANVTRDAAGVPIRMLGMMQDVTERNRAEEQIRQLNQDLERRVMERTAQLEAANSELEAFAYSVSHDLRQPLRHIDGFLGLLKKHLPTLDEQNLHYIDRVTEASRRMAQLINDLLSFSRMGRVEMQKQQVDLRSLVDEVIAELLPDTQKRAIRWEVAPLPAVNGDRSMLHLVLVNLLSNAVKFTRPREEAVIEVGCRPGDPGETVVFVRDNGVGFDPAHAEKLFGVFQRLHAEEQFEGTGIGLANVRRIIKRHGGRTWAESSLDQGATFYFSLPDALKTDGSDR